MQRRSGWPLCKDGMNIHCVVAALTLAVSATMRVFNSVEPLTAVMLLPYLLWTAFATVLNYDVWARNPQVGNVFEMDALSNRPCRQPDVALGPVPSCAPPYRPCQPCHPTASLSMSRGPQLLHASQLLHCLFAVFALRMATCSQLHSSCGLISYMT